MKYKVIIEAYNLENAECIKEAIIDRSVADRCNVSITKDDSKNEELSASIDELKKRVNHLEKFSHKHNNLSILTE